jgi:hypothetical protein
MSQLVTKDFYKSDIYRFDAEIISENLVKFDVSNSISWDIMGLKMTKDELRGLGTFIKNFLGE